MRKQSGKLSKTIVIQIVFAVLGQGATLLAWVQGLVSPEMWAIIAGVLGMLQGLATIARHVMQGGHAADPMPSKKDGKPPTFLALVLLALLVTGCPTPVCKNIIVERSRISGYGPGAQRVTQRCGKGKTTWIVKQGTPRCMEDCFEGR